MRAVRNRRDTRLGDDLGQVLGALLLAIGLVLVLGVVGTSGLVGAEPHDGVRESAVTMLVGVAAALTSPRRGRSPRWVGARPLVRRSERPTPDRSAPCSGHDCLRRGPPPAPAPH